MNENQVKTQPRKRFTTNYMVKIAILGALARIVMFFEFTLPIFPVFLKMDFSDLIVLIGALAMGPVTGVLVELVKCLIQLLSSSTAGIGSLANFIVGGSYVAVVGIFYQRHKSKKGAITGMILGVVAMIISGALVNYFVTIPLYAIFMNLSTETVVGMGTKITPLIHDKITLILFTFVPFNLMKGTIITLIALPLYKKVSPLLKKGLIA